MVRNERWYKSLSLSPLSPPDWVFGVVWPILYVMMAVAAYIAWTSPKCWPYCKPITYFLIQVALNLAWTTLFFKMKRPGLALIDIILIIAFLLPTLRGFADIDPRAYWLLVPYGVWLLFALYLNTYIVLNN